MNWLTIFGLTLGGLVLIFATLRVERRALWLVLVLLVGPALIAIAAWASRWGHWPEVIVGFGLAASLAGLWWALGGHKLPRPTSDNIRVWGQESKTPPKDRETAALQSELKKLQDEAARVEAELRRRRGHNGQSHEGR